MSNKKVLSILVLLVFLVSVACAVPKAKMVFSFENSDGTSGLSSVDNPGWQNTGTSGVAQPSHIGPVADAYPVIVSPGDVGYSNGLKGAYVDLVNYGDPWTPGSYGALHYDTDTTAVLNDAISVTAAFWVKSYDETRPGTLQHSYILNKLDFSIRWRTDAKFFVLWNDVWFGGGTTEGNSYGQWVFLAVTVDTVNGDMVFYKGTQTQPVQVIESLSGLNIEPLRVNNAPTNMTIWGDDSIGTYPGYYLDEIKVYTDNFDGSGALSIEDLEIVRQSAFGPVCGDEDNPFPVGDFTGDCQVDLLDFAKMAANWLVDVNP